MAAQTSKDLAQAIYERFNANDLDSVLAYAADDWRGVAYHAGVEFSGKDGFREFMQGFKGAFPDCTVTLTHQVLAGDELVNEFSWVGTHTGPLPTPAGAIPASGRTVRSVAVEVWRLRDGKLVELRNYQDGVAILAQIGALPMPEPAGL